MLFHRDFRGYSGGHGKVWDYFGHVQAHPGWLPLIHFTQQSISEGNPWRAAGVEAVGTWNPGRADALFVAGLDWEAFDGPPPRLPIINLIQHVRHAEPGDPRYRWLPQPAVRICVSQPVADAILSTGRVSGPVRVIDNGLQLPVLAPSATSDKVLIAGQKQPELAIQLHDLLRASNVAADLEIGWLPRNAFLAKLQAAKIVVALPSPTEGFYLPGLESMALGRATVVPDCVGNRAYLQPGSNALVPEPTPVALAEAVLQLLGDSTLRDRIAAGGPTTAARFTMERERKAFHAILDGLEELWEQAWTATSR